MIVDFPSIKQKLDRIADIYLRAEVDKRMPFLREVGKHRLHEGDKHSYETVDNVERDLAMQEAGTSFSLTREQMACISFPEILKKLDEIAEEMANQIEGGTLQRLSDELEEQGRTVPGNPPLSPETLLQALETVQIDFDEDARDKPNLPMLVLHPDAAVRALEQEAAMTEEERERFDRKQAEILDLKYHEYMEREARRRIVD